MNIRTAYNTLTQKEFVDWALKNNYSYSIKIEDNREHGIIFSKKGNTKYRFDYKIK